MAQRARDMRAEGIDVISLSIGQPDFDTPEHIKQAAIEAMNRGDTGYPPVAGKPELRQAIVDRLKQVHNIERTPEEVIVANGAKQVLFNAFVCSVEAGDEIIIPAPYWVSYSNTVLFAGGVPKLVPTSQDNSFILEPDALEAAITPRTRWLLLNSPGNPTGSVYQPDHLAAIAEVLHRHPDVLVILDDIYEHLIYDTTVTNLLTVDASLTSRCLLVNGVSKAWCMTGWRLGWGIGPVGLIKNMTRMQAEATSGVCTISQAAALAALTGDQSHIEKNNAEYRARRDWIVENINAIPGLSCRKPDGAFYIYIDCSGFIGKRTPAGTVISDDKAFAEVLLNEARVATVHGAAFGMSPFIRASYATGIEDIKRAVERIRVLCESTS